MGDGPARGDDAWPPPPPPPPPPPRSAVASRPAAWPPPAAPPAPRPRPLVAPQRIRSLATWTVRLLVVVVVAELLLLAVSLATGATRQLLYADPLATPTFDRSVLLYAGASLVAAVPGVALVVVFLTWLHRVHLQLTALRGPGALRFGPGLAVGGWFIPFANFVLPLLEVRDLFRASAPGADPDTGDRPPAMLWVWWAALLVVPVVFALTSSVLSFVAGAGSGGPPRALAVTVVLEVGSTLSRAVAAVLAVRLVGELTRRCDRMVDQLGTR